MKQIFERNLEEATITIQSLLGTMVQESQILELFGGKVATTTNEFVPDLKKKNAIVMVGKSCCGKTTFAEKFVKKHPEFKIVSMDKCAFEEMSSLNRNELILLLYTRGVEEMGLSSFSKHLERGKQVIIDGGWMHLNSRIALIKTLRELGYTITILDFLGIPEAEYQKRVEGRALQNIATDLLKIDMLIHPYGYDFVQAFASKYHITKSEAEVKLRSHPSFREVLSKLVEDLKQEESEVILDVQIKYGWLAFGADFIYQINF